MQGRGGQSELWGPSEGEVFLWGQTWWVAGGEWQPRRHQGGEHVSGTLAAPAHVSQSKLLCRACASRHYEPILKTTKCSQSLCDLPASHRWEEAGLGLKACVFSTVPGWLCLSVGHLEHLDNTLLA